MSEAADRADHSPEDHLIHDGLLDGDQNSTVVSPHSPPGTVQCTSQWSLTMYTRESTVVTYSKEQHSSQRPSGTAQWSVTTYPLE